MNPGNKKALIFYFLYFFVTQVSIAEEKILTTPLINLDKLKPSFEDIDLSSDARVEADVILNKKNNLSKNNIQSAKFIGLDKITAKTSEVIVNLGEIKKFGPLEIKVLKCGKDKSNNQNDSVAYLQVKDLSKNQNEKVFIFNGWTFSSDPTLAPFDHAIYDLQLINCSNV